MFALGFKHAATLLIPQLVMDGYKWITSGKVTDNKSSTETMRKKSDTTKITQQMYDFIQSEYIAWRNTDFTKLSSGILCNNHTTFCNHLNYELGLDKSRSSLAKVYNGHINRDDLPPGVPGKIGKSE